MISVQKTTADERWLIANAVFPIMVNVEYAMREIQELWDDYFSCRDQKAIQEGDAAKIERTLYIVSDMLWDACAAFGLLTASTEWSGTDTAREQMKQIEQAFQVEDLADKLHEKEKRLGAGEREKYIKARVKAYEMPDEQAAIALSALLKGV